MFSSLTAYISIASFEHCRKIGQATRKGAVSYQAFRSGTSKGEC